MDQNSSDIFNNCSHSCTFDLFSLFLGRQRLRAALRKPQSDSQGTPVVLQLLEKTLKAKVKTERIF